MQDMIIGLRTCLCDVNEQITTNLAFTATFIDATQHLAATEIQTCIYFSVGNHAGSDPDAIDMVLKGTTSLKMIH